MRILLFTGKGGVGKTTVAAATAVRAAERGRRTLILSTDPAHSLADVFEAPIGDVPEEVGPGLAAQQLDARLRLESVWGDVRSYLVEVLDWAGAAAIEAEELAVVPGLDEVFSLAEIKHHADTGDWDLIVVDCAPTAETVRLLSLPEILRWYMERVFPAQRALTRALRPVLTRTTSMPVAGDGVFDGVRRLYARLRGVRDLLTDAAVTSARLVINTERVVLAESRRTLTYLSLFGYHVDAVIVNRLLPTVVHDPWFDGWRRWQRDQLIAVEESFGPLPVLRVDLAPAEPVGRAALSALGAGLYGDLEPGDRMHEGWAVSLADGQGRLRLSIHLPFAGRDDLELARGNGELVVTVGPHRRAISLPESLCSRAVSAARLVDDRLEVEFGEE